MVPANQAHPQKSRRAFEQGLYEQVLKNARVAAQAEASKHTHRDSPFAAVDNAHPFVLRLDGESGQVLPEGKSAKVLIEIRYQLRPDENRLVLDPETVRGLQATLKDLSEGSEVVKTVVEALLDLPKYPIVLPRGARPALEGGAQADGAVVLPSADPAVLQFNRGALHTSDTNNAQMTVMIGGESAAVRHWYKVGTLTLDAEGRIVGSAMGRPDFQSPRGTQYRKGMNVGGDEVPVILYSDTVMWQGPLGGLNPKQQSAMLALFDASAKRRAELQAEDAYAVDAILGQGLGKMALDLGGIVYDGKAFRARADQGPTRMTLQVLRDGEGLLRVAVEGEGGVAPYRPWAHARPDAVEAPLGKIELAFEYDQGGSPLSRGGFAFPALKRFDYRVEAGTEQAREIAELMEFLKNSFSVPRKPDFGFLGQ
ncbi:hypothetical protein FBR05_05620 [Deltaproteobacteria bacterium PRO3]|nr:hypothetical protein [Deltaproteobacteria bacterium PRO3]